MPQIYAPDSRSLTHHGDPLVRFQLHIWVPVHVVIYVADYIMDDKLIRKQRKSV